MSLFLSIVNILAVFNISKPVGKDGKEYEPEIEWTSGVTMWVEVISLDAVYILLTLRPIFLGI